jgi:glycosyltransferase involved in cell wall biosynthesis
VLPASALATRDLTPVADGLHRVAVLMDTRIVSGPARQLAAIIPPLRASGFDLRVMTFHRAGEPPSAHARFLDELGIPHLVLEDSGPFDASLFGKVSQALAEWGPEIVQTHSYRPTTIAALLRLRRPRWRWVAFFHGTTDEDRKVRLYHWLDRRLLRYADRVVVMARSQRARLERDGLARVTVVGNASVLRAVAFQGEPDHLARLARAPRPRLGVIGRLSPEKGVDVFLEAAMLLRKRGLAFSAGVLGDGPERERLLTRAKALDLDGCVTFFGAEPVVPGTYRELDVVVIPSRSEGLPNVLLEALSEGCPVVATRVGAIPDVIGDSAAAILVPPEAPVQLADAILEATRSGQRPEVVAERRRVAEAWSLERRVAALVQVYRGVLDGAG